MKKILCLLLCAALLVTGCSSAKEEPLPEVPAKEDAINIQLGGEPATLDPAFVSTPDEQSYLIHLYEGLTALSDHLEAVPAVAASWERVDSDTGLITYTFKLNPEAKWSDGEPVKAEDFLYSWKRILDSETDSPVAYQLYPIRGAKAFHQGEGVPSDSTSSDSSSSEAVSSEDTKDEEEKAQDETLGLKVGEEGELIVELEGECYDFLQRLATSAWMPLREAVVTANPSNWSADAAKTLTNGPYTLTAWDHDQQITLEKSESYRNRDAVKADKLNFVLMENQEALLAALQEGTLQLATDLPQLELEAAKEQLTRNVTLGTYTLVFNTQSQALGDPKVRQALSAALDRTKLTAEMRDNSAPATALVPAGAVVEGMDLRKKSGDLVSKTANLDKAKRLLKEAGFENGVGLPTLQYVVNDEGAHKRMAENIAAQWKELGVTVEIVELPWNDYLAYREDGKFDVTRVAVFSDSLYPSVFFDSWLSDSSTNFASYDSDIYDGLIDMSYGREPRKPAKVEPAEGEDKKTDETSAESKADTASSDEKKTDEAQTDDKAEEGEETIPPVKSPVDCLTEAEKLLVEEDAAVVPISWYTNVYLTAAGKLTGFKSYPTGYLYFGEAAYAPPETKKK